MVPLKVDIVVVMGVRVFILASLTAGKRECAVRGLEADFGGGKVVAVGGGEDLEGDGGFDDDAGDFGAEEGGLHEMEMVRTSFSDRSCKGFNLLAVKRLQACLCGKRLSFLQTLMWMSLTGRGWII